MIMGCIQRPLAYVSLLLLLLLSSLSLADSSYRLDAGDRISITVFGEQDLSFELLLGENPMINYPFLGNISVRGLTTIDLEQRISNGLRGDYLINPIVQVNVIEYRPFFIFGEVRRPGSYPYQPGLTVNQALALAGGLSDRAATNSISVFSQNSDQIREAVGLGSSISPGDTIQVGRRFF